MKVIVHLYGGVGNQLFQYVFGEYVRHKYKLNVCYDVASFGVLETYRDYQLEPIVDELPIHKTNCLFFSRHKTYLRYGLRLIYKHTPGIKYICDYEDAFDESILESNKYSTIYFDGYWHNKKFAEWLSLNVPDFFTPKKEVPTCLVNIIEYIREHKMISLHVRRGDYLKPCNSNLVGACENGYYNKAVEMLIERHPNSEILVFSDDNDWVKDNLKFSVPFSIVEDYKVKPFWILYLMSLCNHNIISNSTFSWWGAYLNKYAKKDVVMPKKWYAKQDNPLIYFEEWIKI